MNLVQAIFLSIIEGITEFLPISSTGHLILAAQLLRIPQSEFAKSFEIFIQLGAILGVVFLYWREIKANTQLWRPIFLAFLPAAFVGFIFYKVIKQFLLGNSGITIISLFLGGLVLILLEKFYRYRKNASITTLKINHALFIGAFQALAVVPGVSRAAATIIGGLLTGLPRQEAVKFSFLLAIPTMAAATALDLTKSGFAFSSGEWWLLLIGFGASLITAIFTVKIFVRFVEKHTFIPFGIYRIVIAVAFGIWGRG
ncbi:MAG: undecaprenyl-diphosphate phosphatase [Patescibacteria group bacterium]